MQNAEFYEQIGRLSAQLTWLKMLASKRTRNMRAQLVANIFTERLWRSVKYEEVYLNEYPCPREVRQGLIWYREFYNERRPHQTLGCATPAEIYNVKAPERGERRFL